jgi:glycosyltransferase involved in cell wall biosynthesis
MQISVVIPTCNRKKNLLFLLECLNRSAQVLHEVIIVDSGEDRLQSSELSLFSNLDIEYKSSVKSVCVQRNIGIKAATSEWIFLCDDDIEVPADYLKKLSAHIKVQKHPIAVSGLFLQKENKEWTAKYSITSTRYLLWQYIFKLSIWGEINCSDNFISKSLKRYYQKKQNHISKAGWPVITNFSGEYFTTPLYSLGACLIPKNWLVQSPFDEVLDRHGIGEHYGVITGFPTSQIHVINNAFVYHHHEQENRLQKSLQYYRRVIALDYFRQSKQQLRHLKKFWLLWSLLGNLLLFLFKKNRIMAKATFKVMRVITANKNPYYIAHLNSIKNVQHVFNSIKNE